MNRENDKHHHPDQKESGRNIPLGKRGVWQVCCKKSDSDANEDCYRQQIY